MNEEKTTNNTVMFFEDRRKGRANDLIFLFFADFYETTMWGRDTILQ